MDTVNMSTKMEGYIKESGKKENHSSFLLLLAKKIELNKFEKILFYFFNYYYYF